MEKEKMRPAERTNENGSFGEDTNNSYEYEAVQDQSNILENLLNDLEPVDFYRINDYKPPQQRDYTVMSVDEILSVSKSAGWKLTYSDKQAYLFNGAYWMAVEDDMLKRFLSDAAIKLGTRPNTAKYHKIQDDLIKQFYASAYMPPPKGRNKKILINLKNCTLAINEKGKHLQAFNSDDFLKYQLPFEYNEKATAPRFCEYLNRVLPDVTKQMVIQEFVASIFIPKKRMKMEKVLVLFGDGQNGKSVFFDVLNALLGEANISVFGIGDLCTPNSYSLPFIADKLLNYASEFKGDINLERFKALASGEPQSVRRIYRDPYTMTDYARLMFNCNRLPENTEQTAGFFRRFLIVEFDQTIPDSEADLSFAAKIVATELPGVLNWVLEGLERLLKSGKMTECEATKQALIDYRKQSDSVASFIDERDYKPGIVPTAFKTLYTEYRDYCAADGYKPVSAKSYNQRLKSLGFNIHKKRDGSFIDIDDDNAPPF